jgi:hypothetical protein
MKNIFILLLISIISILLLNSCISESNLEIPDKMPDDFSIYYSCSYNPDQPNALDTYKDKLYKDLILDGIATVDYKINEEKLQEIYEMLKSCEIYKIRQDMNSQTLTGSGGIMYSPCEKYVISFTINSCDYTVTGDSTAFIYPAGKDFKAFCNYMKEFIKSTEEYKSFPDARGGYD